MSNNLNSMFGMKPPAFSNPPRQPMQALPQNAPNPLIRRYHDSYRVARTLISFGTLSKILGLIGGGSFSLISGFAGFVIVDKASRSSSMVGGGEVIFGWIILVIGIGLGLFCGAIFFVLGTLISALGQNLFAMLDTAVHTSPFLDHSQKSQSMLP